MKKNTKFETIIIQKEKEIAKIILNRPEVHNAFNDLMIDELLKALANISNDKNIRILILTGEGKSFCAGADINWMKKMKNYTYEENLQDSLKLAELLYKIYTLPQATIARVNGSAIGGGTGLLAACDIAIASDKAKFSLSEVKLGLVPACISPYVMKRIGEMKCKELFLTGERIDAPKAQEYGLINYCVDEANLDTFINEKIEMLLSSGPKAIAVCKELLQKIPNQTPEEYIKYTAEVIASLRISEEAQEGMNAFLEKRKPKWRC